ncbi:MAG: SufE family protein [Bauldia sp.]|nr:SufE family protein [Bauldia sp.]
MKIEQLYDDFALLDDWEDRYRYLIELGRDLEPLPDAERTAANKVSGCASQVWLWTRVEDGAEPRLRLVGDSDAHIVKGLVAVVLALFDGKTASEIAAIDAEAAFRRLDLAAHLSPQRSNGLRSMVTRIKADARRVAPGETHP